MCSNTSSSSYGNRNDYPGGACLKKQKKERVPRRGPGVAELEKILREQERSSPSSPGNVPTVTDRSLFSPPLPPPPPPALYGNTNHFRATGATNGTSGNALLSSMALPEKPQSPHVTASGFQFPMHLPDGAIQSDLVPSQPVFQRKQHSLHQIQMMSLPQYVVVPTFSNPPSIGLYQFVEPPSNQRSYHNYTIQCPEEEKMVAPKRPRHFLVDSPPNSPVNGNKISRDAVQTSSLDLGLKSGVSDYGAINRNSIALTPSSSSTPSTSAQTCPRDFLNSKFIPMPSPYEPRESNEECTNETSSTNMSGHRKPLFYTFLASGEQNSEEQLTFRLNSKRGEGRGERGVDLTLKL